MKKLECHLNIMMHMNTKLSNECNDTNECNAHLNEICHARIENTYYIHITHQTNDINNN